MAKFVDQIGKYITDDWNLQKSERFKDYLSFEYQGDQVDKSIVSIYVGDRIARGELKVGNIVPIEKDMLSIDEYNAVLLKFYSDIIKPYKERNIELDISQPSEDIFNPLDVISEIALSKLKAFCFGANKSTGSSHPNDQERWLDFICQTVDDERMFNYDTLAKFLHDETYWGKKPEGFFGVMGEFAWDEETAFELAAEYENACEVLKYYKKTRGL